MKAPAVWWVVACATLMLIAPPCRAYGDGPAFLVKDINPLPNPDLYSNPRGFVTIGDTAYFVANDRSGQVGLWRTDGSSEGTMLIRHFSSIAQSPPLLTVGTNVFLVAFDESTNLSTLWRSDGTEDGTIPIFSAPAIGPAVAFRGSLFFCRTYGAPFDLFKTDGTPEGTVHVRAFNDVQAMAATEDKLFLVAQALTQPLALWAGDGTEAGTVAVQALSASSSISSFALVGDSLFLVTEEWRTKADLWKSDGTPEGTALLAEFSLGSEVYGPSELRAAGRLLYFTADDGVHGRELWRSDGTTAGTIMVADLMPGPGSFFGSYCSSSPCLVGAAGPRNGMFFSSVNRFEEGDELWETDGTEQGTRKVFGFTHTEARVAIQHVVSVGREIFFLTKEWDTEGPDFVIEITRLWKSDGTTRGTAAVAAFRHASADYPPWTPIALDGRLLFAVNDGTHGVEPWISDGSTDGTRLVKDINAATGNAMPLQLGRMHDTLFFFADDGVHGAELHSSDGTEAGTRMVRDIRPGKADGFYDYPNVPRPTEFRDNIYFRANDGQAGMELWMSDGTEEGTTLVKDIVPGQGSSYPSALTVAGNTLFFLAQEGSSMYALSLWKTDGTATGTQRVTDRFPAEGSPTELADLNGTLFVATPSGLWRSDGSAEGTTLVRSLAKPSVLRPIGASLYFASGTWFSGAALRSDGKAGGVFVTLRRQGGSTFFVEVGDSVFFDSWSLNQILWRTNGTAEGTKGVLDPLQSEAKVKNPAEPVALGDLLLFSGKEEFHEGPYHLQFVDYELWRSDGTEDGTVRVRDIYPGTAEGAGGENSSRPRYLTVANERVVFSADDGSSGREPWISDATEAGTKRLQDIAPGPRSSEPMDFAVVGSHVFFTANDRATGRELWAVPFSRLESTCVGDCDGDGQVTVAELISGVNISLGTDSVTDCEAFDADEDDAVSVDELVLAVGNALRGCS